MPAAIGLNGVRLVRRTQQELHYDLKRMLLNFVHRTPRRIQRTTVIDGITLQIEHGEKVGIIGPNGSGKSTLLKLIAGVLPPTQGTVSYDGTLTALIELGVGFEPELTLVDNILFYGVLLGHEEALVRSHVDSILDFAELSDIRDHPTKTLSSGMSARLGFAIATEFQPHILLLDEVLAVGDERFRRKCGARIERFWETQTTIVLVSHDLTHVARTCDRALWINDGTIHFDGPADITVQHYLDTVPRATSFRSGEDLIALASRDQRGIVVSVAGRPADSMKLFLVRNGHRWPIETEDWFGVNGFTSDEIISADDAVVREIPEGNVVR